MASTKQARKNPQQPHQRSKSSIPIVGIIFGLVAAVIVGVVVFGDTGGPSDFTAGSPSVTGQLPGLTSGGDAAVGQPAPTVVGENFAGETVKIENDGTAKAIVFLAHWCPHCQTEVPIVQDWIDAGGSVPGLEIYSVATAIDETRPNYPPNDWLIGEDWTPPVVVDDLASTVLRSYGNGRFPYWVFVASDGNVVGRVEGALPIETLEALLIETAAS